MGYFYMSYFLMVGLRVIFKNILHCASLYFLILL